MLLTTANFVTRRREPKDSSVLTKGVTLDTVVTKRSSGNTTIACTLKPKTDPNFFQFPETTTIQTKSTCSSGYGSSDNCSTALRATCVAVETDGFCLTVNPFFYDVTLVKNSEPYLPDSCSFQMEVLRKEVTDNGSTQTVVFYLKNNDQYFLTTTADKQLEINMYNADMPEIGCPDERFFTVFTTKAGQILIQPFEHKGYYFHHLDDKLSVRKLDLNWRAPEEYFFNIVEVSCEIPCRRPEYEEDENEHVKKNKEESECSRVSSWQSDDKAEIITVKGSWSKSKSTPKSKLSVKDLIFGCFGGRSKTLVYQS